MHTHNALFVALLATASVAQSPAESTYVREPDGWVRIDDGLRYRIDPSVVTVRFADSIADLEAFRQAAAQAGVSSELFDSLTTLRTNRLGIHDLRVPAGADVLDVVAAIRATGLVEFCDETCLGTYVADPDDPQYPSQWNWKNTGQSGGTVDADVDADLAWDLERGDPSVTIAVIDSGTQISHPDLAANVWTNVDEIPNNGLDDDGNGYVDDVAGWDFDNDDNDPESGFFHGTFVAGMCCAVGNNGAQVIGLAGGFGPGEGCTVMAEGIGEFFPNGSVLDDAIVYAVDNGARIITLSLGVGFDNAIEAAIAYADANGVYIQNAAGNSGASGVGYPGTNPTVAAIGATTDTDVRASFSSIGPEVWVCAPGDDVTSLDLGGSTTVSSGTSFASPTVAGLAGLLISDTPTLSPDAVKEILRVTSEDKGPAGFDDEYGWGRINAHDALVHLQASDCNGNGVYDWQEIQEGQTPDTNGNGIPDDCEFGPTTYCTAKTSSAGCVASITTTNPFGQPTSGAGDYSVVGEDMQGGKFGVLFGGPTGPDNAPFNGGVLCVAPPLKRGPVLNSFGTNPLTCDGGMSTLVNDGTILPTGLDAGSGNSGWYQYWYRDPQNGVGLLGTALSNAIQLDFQ